MIYQIDERLAAFSRNIWRPVESELDSDVQVLILPPGHIFWSAQPIEGPETDNERFFTMIWNSAKPSRWFKTADMKPSVVISEQGTLVGDVGYDFQFVSQATEANGTTRFFPSWGME